MELCSHRGSLMLQDSYTHLMRNVIFTTEQLAVSSDILEACIRK